MRFDASIDVHRGEKEAHLILHADGTGWGGVQGISRFVSEPSDGSKKLAMNPEAGEKAHHLLHLTAATA